MYTNAQFKQPKLVIFDMDGTMLDTERLSKDSWLLATQQMGFDISSEKFDDVFFNKMMGTNLANCKAVMRELAGSDFDVEKGYALQLANMDVYFEKHGVSIKPGLLPFLDKLESMNIKKCVATSTSKGRATQKLAHANLAHRFEVIVGGDEVTRSKPDPEIFLKAAKHCQTDSIDCLVLEDSAAGTEGAFRAGMRVINIPDILQPTDQVREMAFVVCKDFFEVLDIF